MQKHSGLYQKREELCVYSEPAKEIVLYTVAYGEDKNGQQI